MKKLIALLIAISLVACSSPKKVTTKVKGTDNRYHDFTGFQKKEVKPMFTGW